ncbi:GNAT family N-acetyltransferase [Rheinheimera sp.]|uniref:GNAT family N-acetyltransferase n=1 Tax=Rheinheimera sp. TaxID=1869214 RepID=UPI00307F686E
MSVVICPANPLSAEIQQIFRMSEAYLAALYPAESNHIESAEALTKDNVVFLAVYLDEQLAGCGAVKIQHNDGHYGEIKRVFVLPQFRGRGLSKTLMLELEQQLKQRAVPLARLETGIYQPEALSLYEKLGYSYRPPFAAYQPDPLSVFMEKAL